MHIFRNVFEHYPEYIASRKEKIAPSDGEITVRFLGVTTLLFDDGKNKILFDGMVTRPGMVKAAEGLLDSDEDLVMKIVKEYEFEDLSAIFVSHSHYDHVLDVPNFSKLTGAPVYGSETTMHIVRGNGVPQERIHIFDVNKTYSIGDFKIKVLKSIHSKPNMFNDDLGVTLDHDVTFPQKMSSFPEGGSYDFYIEHLEKKIIIRPSCNYLKGELDGLKCDTLFLGLGVINKLSPKEQEEFYLETVGKTEPKKVVPLHWDDFFAPLEKANDKPLNPLDKKGAELVMKKLKEDGIRFSILPVLYEMTI